MSTESKGIIGLDLGGTKLNSGLASQDGLMLDRKRTMLEELSTPISQHIVHQALEFKLIGERMGLRVSHAGLGIPGVFTGTDIALNANLKNLDLPWINRQLKLHDISLSVMNDVRCAALGEHWKGVAKGCANFIFVNLGTGLSIGIYSDNRILGGANNAAGEIAYMLGGNHFDRLKASNWSFDPENGPLEGLISGAALDRAAKRLKQNGQRMNPKSSESAKTLFLRSKEGDFEANQVIQSFIAELSRALIDLSVILDPDMIVFGGSVSENFDYFGPFVSKAIQQHTPYPPTLKKTILQGDAGLYGAFYLASLEGKPISQR